MPVLTSNENVQRLERLGMQALRSRSFAKAECIFRDQVAMLKDFRYTDELSLAITLNNLALALELQGKTQRADNLRRASLQIAAETINPVPCMRPPISLVAV